MAPKCVECWNTEGYTDENDTLELRKNYKSKFENFFIYFFFFYFFT